MADRPWVMVNKRTGERVGTASWDTEEEVRRVIDTMTLRNTVPASYAWGEQEDVDADG